MFEFIVKLICKLRYTIKLVYFKCVYNNRISLGEGVFFRDKFKVILEENAVLRIGNSCFFNNYCSINCLGEITIGDYCIFGENVKMYDHNHMYSNLYKRILNQGFSIGKITIGNNCWIGSNVTILNNVDIGDNVVIGANCLIYKSIPSNSVVKNNSELLISNK
jgi:Acetyltransferase (isoleucine patch superfamily)